MKFGRPYPTDCAQSWARPSSTRVEEDWSTSRSPNTAAAIYQRLFAVPRGAFKLLGARGMDAVFGVGNTGRTASIAQQTGALFGVLGLLALGAAAAVKAATRP